jgi:Tol biopolymer transport system component
MFAPPHFALTSETQLTSDGAQKSGLVTDGAHLYFGEMREGRTILSAVPVNGGPIREIPTPFVQAEPLDVSPDGRLLLVLAGEGEERERSLWILPLDGGAPSRVGSLLCHTAAWSPDGRLIAFAYGNEIYLTADGATDHLLQTFTVIPQLMRWSLDGKRILVRLRNPTDWDSVLWELRLGGTDHSTVTSLTPTGLPPRDYNDVSSILDRKDNAFVVTGKTIWVLQRKQWPWQSGFNLTELATEMNGHDALAADTGAHRFYVMKETAGRDELDWFDRKSHQFRPFLPGISAHDVDFSRDGRWIAYIREPENTLWVSGSDGSSTRNIPTPGMTNLELPRWSPDGKQIAFMGKFADAPYRIFVVDAAGGYAREASHGTDNQGAPTWSPDGQFLVYGRVWCQEEKTCVIQQIDLETGAQTMLPGSEGLSTARWSPDGRLIAALRADQHEVWLLDRRTGTWRKIADGANGNDLAWAPDSHAVYASHPNGARPDVIRISIDDGRVEPAVDLSDFSKLSGRIDTWFAVTPDDSILFDRILGGHEIWAFNYTTR